MPCPFSFTRSSFHTCCLRFVRNLLLKASGLVFALLAASSANAQTQQEQQYVFASVPLTSAGSDVAGFSKDANGNLSAVPNSPVADSLEGGFVAVDALWPLSICHQSS